MDYQRKASSVVLAVAVLSFAAILLSSCCHVPDTPGWFEEGVTKKDESRGKRYFRGLSQRKNSEEAFEAAWRSAVLMIAREINANIEDISVAIDEEVSESSLESGGKIGKGFFVSRNYNKTIVRTEIDNISAVKTEKYFSEYNTCSNEHQSWILLSIASHELNAIKSNFLQENVRKYERARSRYEEANRLANELSLDDAIRTLRMTLEECNDIVSVTGTSVDKLGEDISLQLAALEGKVKSLESSVEVSISCTRNGEEVACPKKTNKGIEDIVRGAYSHSSPEKRVAYVSSCNHRDRSYKAEVGQVTCAEVNTSTRRLRTGAYSVEGNVRFYTWCWRGGVQEKVWTIPKTDGAAGGEVGAEVLAIDTHFLKKSDSVKEYLSEVCR